MARSRLTRTTTVAASRTATAAGPVTTAGRAAHACRPPKSPRHVLIKNTRARMPPRKSPARAAAVQGLRGDAKAKAKAKGKSASKGGGKARSM